MKSPVPGLRSPADRVGDLIYFGRMLDKIRLHLAGTLPEIYHANLGGGFDERCIHFLRISYRDLWDHLAAHPDSSDEDLYDWALSRGRHPADEEIEVWNEFMRKRGWKDDATPRLVQRKADDGFAGRADIETMFQYIDADEGRF